MATLNNTSSDEKATTIAAYICNSIEVAKKDMEKATQFILSDVDFSEFVWKEKRTLGTYSDGGFFGYASREHCDKVENAVCEFLGY